MGIGLKNNARLSTGDGMAPTGSMSLQACVRPLSTSRRPRSDAPDSPSPSRSDRTLTRSTELPLTGIWTMQLNDLLAGAKLPRLDGAEPRALLMPTFARAKVLRNELGEANGEPTRDQACAGHNLDAAIAVTPVRREGRCWGSIPQTGGRSATRAGCQKRPLRGGSA